MKKIDKKAIMAEIVLNKTLITTLLTKQKDFILKKKSHPDVPFWALLSSNVV